MNTITCVSCGKTGMVRNEIGIEVTPQDILDKIEEFKEDGCKLFE